MNKTYSLNKKVFLFLTLFLAILFLLPSFASAIHHQPYHLKLLAVEESQNGFAGSPADLFLEVKPGSGRVFLETYPLTKVDTQASTRFAKDIACQHFKLNCGKYDFIYTIKAESNIVGGPSAGAAIAALTTVALLDLEYDQSITITGTINSGGIVGPVGGIPEKIDAAAKAGLKKVLVPKGAKSLGNETNETITINQTSSNQTISLEPEVVEVIDLDEVILHLTGKDLNHRPLPILENRQYAEIMTGLANVLCSRTEKIRKELADREIRLEDDLTQNLQQRQGLAANASRQGDYYSAASFCFGTNIQLKSYYYQQEEVSTAQLEILFAQLEKKVKELEEKVKLEKIDTISDLQTLMIVQERLSDVRQNSEEFQKEKELRPAAELAGLLAYSEERYFSALSWFQFFSMEGKKFVFNEELLKRSCQQKISEAEERIQYVGLYVSEAHTAGMQEKEEAARKSLKSQDYALCLMQASQAKADANAVLGILGLRDEIVDEFIESKRKAVERVIVENTAEGIFPIMGFSYYQYANSLKGGDKFTALVYLEDALEMSDLGIYFPEEQKFLEKVEKKVSVRKEWVYVGGGILMGAIAVLLVLLAVKWMGKKKVSPKGSTSGKRKKK